MYSRDGPGAQNQWALLPTAAQRMLRTRPTPGPSWDLGPQCSGRWQPYEIMERGRWCEVHSQAVLVEAARAPCAGNSLCIALSAPDTGTAYHLWWRQVRTAARSVRMTGRGLGSKVLPELSCLSADLLVTEPQAMMAVWNQVRVTGSTPALTAMGSQDLSKG